MSKCLSNSKLSKLTKAFTLEKVNLFLNLKAI